MTIAGFSQLFRAFKEPFLLLTNRGEIQAANQAITTVFNCKRKQIIGKNLLDFVRETPEEVLAYLKLCSQSSSFTIGSLTFLRSDGKEVAYRVEGAVVQPQTENSPALNLLRFQSKEVAINDFTVLNQQIEQLGEELGKELQRRKQAESELQRNNEQLRKALTDLKLAQIKLIQTEKMSGLGQLVAGIAHEINNPVNFIEGNLSYLSNYLKDLIELIKLYQAEFPDASLTIKNYLEAIELNYLIEDSNKIIRSMELGSQRLSNIVRSLRTFSRLDEAKLKEVNIHEGIESTLSIIQYRLKKEGTKRGIKLIKKYGDIPLIECYPSHLNQVFFNLLNNAIDALLDVKLEETLNGSACTVRCIWIHTEREASDRVKIRIRDNGTGIKKTILPQIFNPFFTTKPIGQGTGLGLAISYQIATQMHQGSLSCNSIEGEGTEFVLEIPIFQSPVIPLTNSALFSPATQEDL
ncbi:ATP-binding protein [Oscillatoria sp. FACHB-1406]|uniref:PAS domain-containing sensor histidine kinase n=1 Tax=Oscillatoria sp. FACHB-1406 TaxID=2692846 RepID=UPI001685F0E6|nr:ATP-binding protein [Oscillatoria sp. FACHB-1406]MBD2580376.1 PAS domain-containing protein [Oscillatoria sp. FACHB-1406]